MRFTIPINIVPTLTETERSLPPEPSEAVMRKRGYILVRLKSGKTFYRRKPRASLQCE